MSRHPVPDASHRPWPPPERPPAMLMSWHDLLFAHWPVAPELLAPSLPAGLELDLYDGRAWLGVVPFRMSGVRPRGMPSLPWLSAFPELNVRTYVSAGGEGGVWFFSLDAANPVAVRAARWLFHLPYFDARMTTSRQGETVSYSCERTHRGAPAARFTGRYGPSGPVYRSRPGDLDHWLTERYCLYAAAGGRLYRGEVDHPPWPLQPAAAEVETDTMADDLGLGIGWPAPLLHFADRLDVVAWSLEEV